MFDFTARNRNKFTMSLRAASRKRIHEDAYIYVIIDYSRARSIVGNARTEIKERIRRETRYDGEKKKEILARARTLVFPGNLHCQPSPIPNSTER